MEWRFDILQPATKKALDFASGQKWLAQEGWYLAGGTALALQAGHRESIDLDFFLPQKTFLAAEITSRFPDDDKKLWDSTIVKEGTVYGKLCHAKVSFIAYPFFSPARPKLHYGSVAVLDKDDIAVMKVIALSQRGRKRDFVDLFWYGRNVASLDSVIKKLPHQYPGVGHNFEHIIKALTYFDDAEDDPMPTLFFKASWEEVKAYFRKEVPAIAKKIIGLE
ncbi:MAG TPA: nucleotidyl transferase AbiEii/AbiGii toxin family protein [Candidatus Paceibacterota bacterium]